MKRTLIQKIFSVFVSLSIIFQSVYPGAVLLARPVFAEDATPAAIVSDQTTTTDISTPSAAETTPVTSVDTTAAQEATPPADTTVTTAATDSGIPATGSATIEATPSTEATPEAQPTETNQATTPSTDTNTIDNSSTPEIQPEVAGQSTTNNTEVNTQHGSLSAVVLENTSAASLNLDSQSYSSATLTTNKPDYAPTETVVITGSDFIPNQEYTLYVSSTDPPAVNFSTQITANSLGSFIYAYRLDGNYRPNYTVEVKLGDSVVASTTFTDSITYTPIIDTAGANDEPGQKDLTKLERDLTSNDPLYIAWNWDVTSMPGSNTADACALFDTNNNGLANYSLCVTWDTTQHQITGSPSLYSCNDTKVDRCSGATLITTTLSSSCSVGNSTDDPFPTGDSYPNDTKATCSIPLSDVGGATHASLLDVCSYPSVQPNSDPSDCIIIQTDKGNLTIIKDVVPDNANTNWNFTVTGATSFNTSISGDGTSGINSVDTGTYAVVETAGSNTNLSDYSPTWACIKNGSAYLTGSGSTASGVVIGKSGSVEDSVVCTFTNTRVNNGSITIVKDAQPNDPQDFAFTTTGSGLSSFSLDDDSDPTLLNTKVFSSLAAGTYTVSEGAVTDWTQTSATCTDGSPVSAISLQAGENVTCTFTNTAVAPKLTVTKVVTNNNGGTKVVSDFPLFIGTTPVTSGVQNTISVGSYTVSETADNGYTSAITGDCAANGTITLVLGDVKTCTITNNDNAPSLTLNKIVVNNNGGTQPESAWTITATGPTTISGPGAAGSTDVVSGPTFSAGTYTLSESGPSGYNTSSWACTNGITVNGSNEISIGLGQSTACTITNDDIQPKLTLTKAVVNDDGGNAVVSDFPLFVSATPVTSGVQNGFNAGSYTASETNLTGYTAGSWTGDCVANGTITLAAGDVKACSITNNDQSAHIVLTKVVNNNHGGTAVPNDFDVSIDGVAVLSGTTHDVNSNTSHILNEDGSTGYEFVSLTGDTKCPSVLGGSVTLDEGETVHCTITNDDQPARLNVIKHVVGGSAQASDFNIFVDAENANPETFDGQEAGTPVTLNAGDYSVSEGQVTGYTPSYSEDCTGGISNGQEKTCTITNTRDTGSVLGYKFNDLNGDGSDNCNEENCDPKLGGWTINLYNDDDGSLGSLVASTQTSSNEETLGQYSFEGIPTGSYWVCESNQNGWTPTYPNNDSSYPRCWRVTVGEERGGINFGNQRQNPILTISKSNNASGDKSPGDSVLFTLTVTATQSAAYNVFVTDLPAGGFKYHSGSWSTTKNSLPFAVPEPTYASPGVWTLGNMAVNDVIVLTYTADIAGDQKPGLYKDLAWAAGCKTDASCSVGDSNSVLSNAVDPGFVAENFVGTQVNIVTSEESTTSVQGQVLGASTILPATGGNTIWLILASLLTLFGFGLMAFGLIRRGFFSKLLVLIIGISALLSFVSYPVQAFGTSLSIRIEQPKSPTFQNSFNINFVTLDILGRDITVKCFKKGPSDGGFSQFGSTIAISAGGNTGNCSVDSGIINTNNATYQFYVEAFASADTASSAIDSVDYNTSSPGTPSNYSKDHSSACQYKINFKTADDSGKTVKVEIYRSTGTSFNLDGSTRVGSVSVGSNTDGNFTDTVPDCGATYYYAIRAFDSAGNGSGTVGDDLTTTTVTSAAPAAGTGAIPVSGVNIPTGPGVLSEEKTASEEGQTLGEATPDAAVVNPPTSPKDTGLSKGSLALLVLLGLVASAYVFSRRQKAS